MPRHATITFKNNKASLREITATFSDEEWERLRSDWACVTDEREISTKAAYKCVVDGKGSEEIEILLDLRDIMAIV